MTQYQCCSTTTKSQNITALAKVLKLVAEENRLRILCILQQGEHCVSEMMVHLTLSQSLISHHLRDLKQHGLVTHQKRGLKVYYRLSAKGNSIVSPILALPLQLS